MAIFSHLGGHVARRPHHALDLHCLAGQEAAQPQVPQHDVARASDEDVAWLDVPVHHAEAVHVEHGVADLRSIGWASGYGIVTGVGPAVQVAHPGRLRCHEWPQRSRTRLRKPLPDLRLAQRLLLLSALLQHPGQVPALAALQHEHHIVAIQEGVQDGDDMRVLRRAKSAVAAQSGGSAKGPEYGPSAAPART